MLAGIWLVRDYHDRDAFWPSGIDPLFWDADIVWLGISFGAAMAGIFILNQLQDIESDRENNKLFLLGDGYIPVLHGWLEAIVMMLVALVIAARLDRDVLIYTALFIVVSGYFYNYKPFEFKNFPLRGLLANMAMGWLAFCLGWLLYVAPSWTMVIASLPYLTYNTALYFLTTLPDVKGDSAVRKITFPVRYGYGPTIWLSFILFFSTIVISVVQGNGFMCIISTLVMPFIARAVYDQRRSTAVVAVKLGIFFFALGVCLKFPPFLLMMLVAFGITKFYYKKRFNLDYPNFKGQ